MKIILPESCDKILKDLRENRSYGINNTNTSVVIAALNELYRNRQRIFQLEQELLDQNAIMRSITTIFEILSIKPKRK